MPLAYPDRHASREHLACRERRGRLRRQPPRHRARRGSDCARPLQQPCATTSPRSAPGRAQYTQLLNDEGGVLDDIIVWWVDRGALRRDAQRLEHRAGRSRRSAATDVTAGRCVLAVQGPSARARLAAFGTDAAAVRPLPRRARRPSPVVQRVRRGNGLHGRGRRRDRRRQRRTPSIVFAALLAAGIVPAGLGARDTLRLEAALPLHGHELAAVDHPARGGARLGRRLGQGRVPRPRGAARAARRGSEPRRSAGFAHRVAAAAPRRGDGRRRRERASAR